MRQLPPLTEAMYWAARGALDERFAWSDDDLDNLWDAMNTALRAQGHRDEALRIEEDEQADTVTINGIRFARALFDDFGSAMPVGQAFRLVSRDGGTLTVERFARGVKALPGEQHGE